MLSSELSYFRVDRLVVLEAVSLSVVGKNYDPTIQHY